MGMDEIREKNRIRKQKERLKKKELKCHVTVTGRHDIDTDTDTDTDNNIYILSEISLSDERELFNFWNSQEIIIHQDKTFKTFHSKLKTKLKTYTIEEIKKSIRHYNFILKSNEYYWTHKWTLKEFLDRGLEKFMIDLETLKENYRKKNGSTNENRESKLRSLAEDIYNDPDLK